MTDTWCTLELEKAVEMGCVIHHVHEVCHFEETRRGLFAEYVNTWLTSKWKRPDGLLGASNGKHMWRTLSVTKESNSTQVRRLQSGSMGLSQINAQFLVGQVWTER